MTETARGTGAALLKTGSATTAPAGDRRDEITNLIAFDIVDFVGWNNADMDVMRRYHAASVAVDMAGTHTDGIDAHVDMLQQILATGIAPKIVQHDPQVAEGAWTAVVGVMTEGSMATVAKWRDGAMTEEYLFLRPMTPDELTATDTANPVLSLTTPDDAALRVATGAAAGWSAQMGTDHAVFTLRVAGAVVERLGFARQ